MITCYFMFYCTYSLWINLSLSQIKIQGGMDVNFQHPNSKRSCLSWVLLALLFICGLYWCYGIYWFIKRRHEDKRKNILVGILSAISALMFLGAALSPDKPDAVNEEPDVKVTATPAPTETPEPTNTPTPTPTATATPEPTPTTTPEPTPTTAPEPAPTSTPEPTPEPSAPPAVDPAAQETGADSTSPADSAADVQSEVPQPTPKEQMVWVDDTAAKYHSKPNCSGMDAAYQVTKSEAEAMGKTPCKRCY